MGCCRQENIDKIVDLIKDIKRSPYSGKGKAEPLNIVSAGVG